MTILEKVKDRLVARAPIDVVGLSCGDSEIRAVRIRKAGVEFQIVGAGKYPKGDHTATLKLETKTRARYAGLCLPSLPDSIKLLRVDETFDTNNRLELASRLALDPSSDIRINHRLVLTGIAKRDSRILLAGMTQEQCLSLMQLVPPAGMPAARSLELSEIAVMNAFHQDAKIINTEGAYGFIHFEEAFSLIALFNNKALSQLRIFKFGVADVLRKVMNALNVDQPTAEAVLMDGAFDISHLFEEGYRDIRSQLVISRDFMERSENCVLDRLFISGPVSLTRPFKQGISGSQAVEEWNVLESYPEVSPGAIPDELIAEPWRLVASIGVCLGLLLPT